MSAVQHSNISCCKDTSNNSAVFKEEHEIHPVIALHKSEKKVTLQNLFSSLLLRGVLKQAVKHKCPPTPQEKWLWKPVFLLIPQLWTHRIQGWKRPVPASCSPHQKATAGMLNKIQQNKPVKNQHKQTKEMFPQSDPSQGPSRKAALSFVSPKVAEKMSTLGREQQEQPPNRAHYSYYKSCSQEQEGQASLSSKTTLEGDVLENKPLGYLGYFAAFSKGEVPKQVNRAHKDVSEACQCSIV